MPGSPQDVVDCIAAGWESGESDETIAERLHELGICNGHALDAIELVRTGFSRAVLFSAGMQPYQFSSDFEKDPIFLAAISKAKQQIESHPPPDPKTFSELERDVGDADAQIRQTAVYELGQLNNPSAIPLLINSLDDEDDFVRVYAIQSLSALCAKDAVTRLCTILDSERNRTILSNAIKALVNIADLSAVPALIQATNDVNAFVRHDAAWALGELRDHRAIPSLESLLNDNTKPIQMDENGLLTQSSIYRVCDHAKMALEKLGKKTRPWWRLW